MLVKLYSTEILLYLRVKQNIQNYVRRIDIKYIISKLSSLNNVL